MKKPGLLPKILLLVAGVGCVVASAYLQKLRAPAPWPGVLMLIGLGLESVGGVGLLYQLLVRKH